MAKPFTFGELVRILPESRAEMEMEFPGIDDDTIIEFDFSVCETTEVDNTSVLSRHVTMLVTKDLERFATRRQSTLFSFLAECVAPNTQVLFAFYDKLSFILPAKTRQEVFEPAFEDEKHDYVKWINKHPKSRGFLTMLFGIHFWVLMAQSLGSMISEKMRKVLWATLGGLVMWFR